MEAAGNQRAADYLKLPKPIVATAAEKIYVLSESKFLVKGDS